MDPVSMYSSMMLANGAPGSYDSYSAGVMHSSKLASHGSSSSSDSSASSSSSSSSSSPSSPSSSSSAIDFTDYDDDFGNYYMRKAASGMMQMGSIYRADKREELMSKDERESLHDDSDSGVPNKRVKRQAYESSYQNEPPCYGFPLEINVKSRIKLGQIFPIHGKSQFKKCIKVG